MNIEIKILLPNEIDQAIKCFATAIARDWPNSEEEATNWVRDEFYNSTSIILGAFIEKRLVGVCSLIDLDFILKSLEVEENNLIIEALANKLGIDTGKIIYIGGFGVEEKFERIGIGTKLFTFAEKTAINNGYEALLGQTARPSKKYEKIKELDFALSVTQMKELPLAKTIFLPSPNDLEKVWLYKLLK